MKSGQGCGALVENRVEPAAVPVLPVPLEVPEETTELQALLLAQAQHVRPGDTPDVELLLPLLPHRLERRLAEELLHLLVREILQEGRVPDRVRNLLPQRPREDVGPLREEKDLWGTEALKLWWLQRCFDAFRAFGWISDAL